MLEAAEGTGIRLDLEGFLHPTKTPVSLSRGLIVVYT
jgi:hypothetical protein